MLKLNSEKVRAELDRMGKNQSWLARQCGVSRQYVHDCLRLESIGFAEKAASVFHLSEKELVKEVRRDG